MMYSGILFFKETPLRNMDPDVLRLVLCRSFFSSQGTSDDYGVGSFPGWEVGANLVGQQQQADSKDSEVDLGVNPF